jgi:hypothetical protein
LALGAALGLALATKVSALPLLLAVVVAHTLAPTSAQSPKTRLRATCRRLALTLFVAAAILVLAQPYALIDWPTFLNDTLRESQIAWGALDVPYTRQYAGTLPYLYSIWQTALWGLGLPLGLVAWAAFAAALVRWLRHGARADTLLLAWAGPHLAITGLLHARYLRYMLPLVPILCLWAVQALEDLWQRRNPGPGNKILDIGYWALLVCTFAYSLAFVSLYAAPHPWIAASEWIYRRVPEGSVLSIEEWDTALPLPLDVDGRRRRIEAYDVRFLALYDEPDSVAKWEALAAHLADSDFLVLASRRLYGSIPRLPQRYPLTTDYYDRLFAGDLGFELAAVFTRAPTWLNPRLPPLPGAAPAWLQPDESFVVYDHPRTLILKNVEYLPADEILRRLRSP